MIILQRIQILFFFFFFFFCVGGGGGVKGVARLSDFFLQRIQI